jgi:hypothetical protein
LNQNVFPTTLNRAPELASQFVVPVKGGLGLVSSTSAVFVTSASDTAFLSSTASSGKKDKKQGKPKGKQMIRRATKKDQEERRMEARVNPTAHAISARSKVIFIATDLF